jgi:hypothetical protein
MKRLGAAVALACAVCAPGAGAGPADAAHWLAPGYRSDASTVAVEVSSPVEPSPGPSLGARLLWYLPNRAMDLADVFRLRLRAGPGLAVNVRFTDYGAFYVGAYDAVYAGMPGPRGPRSLRLPWGREQLKGIAIAGVDATDDTRHGPGYGRAESDVGAHLLLVGAEAGIDAAEVGDFLGGLLGFDPMGDDYPRPHADGPEWTSALSPAPAEGVLAVQPKPARFDSTSARLDYLRLNVHRRLSEPLRATDAHFAVDPAAPIPAPQSQFRLGASLSFIHGEDFSVDFSPNFSMDVQLPNLEQKLRVFVESARTEELPQSSPSDSDETGFSVGARKFFEKTSLSFDAGVRVSWPPEAFVRLRWRPDWSFGEWGIRPEQRLFYDSTDKFGTLTSIAATRWLGDGKPFAALADASAKYTTAKEEVEWAASFKFAYVISMLDERQRGLSADWQDAMRAVGFRASTFGTDGSVQKYRIAVGLRRPLYQRWIYGELAPGLEWARDNDFDVSYFVHLGIDLLFWGRDFR